MGDGKKASGFVPANCEQALRRLRLREASAVEFLGLEQGGANREERVPFQPRHEFSITFPGLAQGVAHDRLRNQRLLNNVLRDTPQKANSWQFLAGLLHKAEPANFEEILTTMGVKRT